MRGGEEVIYDYTHNNEEECLEIEIETLTGQQREEVQLFNHDLKDGRGKKDTERYIQWLRYTVLPTLHEYARVTYSVLEIEETKAKIHIQMKNKYGYDIGTSDRAVKLALYLADYMGIDTDNGIVRMNLSYGIG